MQKQNTLLTLIITLLLAHSIIFAFELPITVLICSYNNEQWVKKNLDSVMSQKYHNFKILYIDDCSTDATASQVQCYITQHNLQDKIILVCNQTRFRKMKNIYNGVHACNDDDIIIQLDGDDWFIHDELFAHINHLYQTKDIWLTYGSDTLGYAQPTSKTTISKRSYRQEKWVYAPTRSFYAWLFKAIKLEDFIAEHVKGYQGLFFPSADDVAFMYPMLEMAGYKHAFIPRVNYKVNTHNPLSNKKIAYDLQEASSQDIRSRPPYKQLEKPQVPQEVSADVLIISDNAYTLQASNILLPSHCNNAETITIIHTAHHDEHEALKNALTGYHFVAANTQELADIVKECLYQTPHEYVLITYHNHSITKPIDVRYYSTLLAKTGAHALYFDVSAEHTQQPLQHLFDDIYAWKLAWNQHTIQHMHDVVLLRKNDLCNPKELNPHAIGLCLRRSVLERPLAEITLHVPCTYTSDTPKKNRRLHKPGIDPRTKEKHKRKKNIQEEPSYA